MNTEMLMLSFQLFNGPQTTSAMQERHMHIKDHVSVFAHDCVGIKHVNHQVHVHTR